MSEDRKSILIFGLGARGLDTYARYLASNAPSVEVVGVADPNPAKLEAARTLFPSLPDHRVQSDWRPLLAQGRIADAAIVSTHEPLHAPIAIACAEAGYHILLEKPMAPNEADCRAIAAAANRSGVMLAVCHVLRYTPFYRSIRSIIESGVLGEVVHVQHAENVATWHFTHSFVRGHSRNTDVGSFVLLSKSCHDIDILRFLIGRRCLRVQSFGGLKHFKRSAKPAEAGDAMRCTDCAYEPKCPYSALKIYVRDRAARGDTGWPTSMLTPEQTVDGVRRALREGPYGRCVYECDNNVADHQVVNLEYDGGITAAFTLSAFTEGGRRTVIEGTRGVLHADLATGSIRWMDFLTQTWHDAAPIVSPSDTDDGHGGGDGGLMRAWLAALATGDRSTIVSGADESLETHLTTFAAERSRLSGKVETIQSP